jgi:hypothetical protein
MDGPENDSVERKRIEQMAKESFPRRRNRKHKITLNVR